MHTNLQDISLTFSYLYDFGFYLINYTYGKSNLITVRTHACAQTRLRPDHGVLNNKCVIKYTMAQTHLCSDIL